MIDGGRMMLEYRRLIEKVEGNMRHYRVLLNGLSRRRPSDLDTVFREATREAFDEIDCLQCANCCVTTGPLLLERDIDRVARSLRKRPAELVEEMLHRDEDGDWVFRTLPCPFLDEDNRCMIYSKRPKACREYPHTDSRNVHQLFQKTLRNALICPIVARVLQLIEYTYGGAK